ncbi:MAG: hypothetical protein J6Y97_10520 [Prevotella sp.]|nr:hypothetical protein [Prevotella sp.]MBP5506613.1 hypothetical protein [Prevotella sp.]
MNKIIILIAALLLPMCAMAQKSYVNVVALGVNNSYGHKMYLSGDIPSGLKSFYDDYYDKVKIGEIINQLASHGFVVEHISCTPNESSVNETILLSKNTSPAPTQVRNNTLSEPEGETVEVARYNLQGMPVKPHEKGVQIVVYSNYTTRTVIVE